MNCVRTCNIFREIITFISRLLSFNHFLMNLSAIFHKETQEKKNKEKCYKSTVYIGGPEESAN